MGAALQQVDDLAARHRAAAAREAEDARALTPLLPLIERLSLFPAETLLAAPATPEDAVRGALVVGGLMRQLRERAARVSTERQQVAALQADLDAALPRLRAAEQAQRSQAASLDSALAQARLAHQAARTQADLAAGRAEADAARAASLRDAVAALDAARVKATREATREAARTAARAAARAMPPARAASSAAAPPAALGHGAWVAPASGRLLRGFGAAGDAGPATGMTVQPPPGARVVSPCAGRAMFAAPFRSYGQLVIVDCGGGSDVVLAGLGRLDVAAGQAVQRGEPVGVMAGQGGTLYVELRRGGQAIDPAPYLRPGL